jgi:DNA segregation ATPase FtsK/SpoIIIE-like protein
MLMVVLEEYPGILEAAQRADDLSGARGGDRLAPRIAADVASLVAQGAKVGVRVLLLIQRAEASIMSGAVRANAGTRMTLKVDNTDSVRMLHPSATSDEAEPVGRFAPGVALFEGPGIDRCVMRNLYVPTYGHYFDQVLNSYTPFTDPALPKPESPAPGEEW